MEDQQTEIIDDIELLKKPKPKRPQSDAQKAVWAKAQQTRLNNAKLKKDALNKAKEDIESAKAKATPPTSMSPPVALAKPKVKSSPKIVYQEESEDEPEVIVVKKKKKKPPVIYQEESSSEEEAPPPPKKVSIPRYSAPVAPMAPKPIVRFF